MPHLSLFLLGAFEATLDGEPITAFGSDKARGLLAFLAVESARPHRRAELAGMFWPDSRKKRRRTISARPCFACAAPCASQSVPHSPSPRANPFCRSPLRTSSSTHAATTGSTSRALASCSGPPGSISTPMPRPARPVWGGCTRPPICTAATCWPVSFLRDSVGFEEWRLVQQERLHRQAVELLGRLATDHEGRGEHEQVQRYAGQLVALEPWHERGLLQWMRALARGGQTAAALEQVCDLLPRPGRRIWPGPIGGGHGARRADPVGAGRARGRKRGGARPARRRLVSDRSERPPPGHGADLQPSRPGRRR